MTVSRVGRLAMCALALTMTIGVTACGTSGGSAAPSGFSSGSPGNGSMKLSVWFPGSDPAESAEVKNKLVPEFEKQTGATVDVTYVDYTNLSTKLSSALAAGTAPDIFGNGPAAAADLVINQRVAPLDADIASMSAADRTDLAAALAGGKVDGKQYLVPLQMTGSLLAYNRADFTAAGLDPNKLPTTWEGVRDAAEKLTVRNSSGTITRSGLLMPTDPIGREQSFATLTAAAGGTLVGSDGVTAFNTAQGSKALDFYTSLFTGAGGPKPVSTGLGDTYSANAPARQPLVLHTASITMLAGNAIAKIQAANPKLDIGVMPPPAFEGVSQGKAFGGAGPGLMINADSSNKDLAWKFVKFMIDPTVNLAYVQSFGGVPVRAAAATSAYVTKSPVLEAIVKAFGQFVPNPNVPSWVQARDTMDGYLEKALHGQLSTKDTLAQMAGDVDKVLKSNQ